MIQVAAPMDGLIWLSNIRVGQEVSIDESAPLASIADPRFLQAVIEVGPEHADVIQPGMKILLKRNPKPVRRDLSVSESYVKEVQKQEGAGASVIANVDNRAEKIMAGSLLRASIILKK